MALVTPLTKCRQCLASVFSFLPSVTAAKAVHQYPTKRSVQQGPSTRSGALPKLPIFSVEFAVATTWQHTVSVGPGPKLNEKLG